MKKILALTMTLVLMFSLTLVASAASAPFDTLAQAAGGKTPLMNVEYIDGGDGFNDKEGSKSLTVYDEDHDANEDGMFPKYCTNQFPYWCEWKYDKAYVIDRIILRTANDSEQYIRRPADGWKLSGSNDGKAWKVIYTGKADDIDDENFTYYFVDLPNNTEAYQYYQFYAEDYWPEQNDTIIQLSMVILCGNVPAPPPAAEPVAVEAPAAVVEAAPAPAPVAAAAPAPVASVSVPATGVSSLAILGIFGAAVTFGAVRKRK